MPTTNGCLTNYAEQKLLDHLVNNTTWTMPTCYLALWQASPTDTGAASSEVTTPATNGYDRIAIGTAGSSKFTDASGTRTTSTNVDITFGPSSGGPWGTVGYWALLDASSGGNMIAYGDLTDVSIGTGDSYKITSGNLTISFTAGSKWTDATCGALLNHLTGRAAYTSPSAWLALFEGDPLGAGVETETAGANGYARQDLDAAMSPASGGSITNGSSITFGPASANWGTVDYMAVYDASTAGTKLGGAALDTSKAINDGDSASFAASALTFTLD